MHFSLAETFQAPRRVFAAALIDRIERRPMSKSVLYPAVASAASAVLAAMSASTGHQQGVGLDFLFSIFHFRRLIHSFACFTLQNFFSKRSFKSNPLKRTKSVTKLERKRPVLDANP